MRPRWGARLKAIIDQLVSWLQPASFSLHPSSARPPERDLGCDFDKKQARYAFGTLRYAPPPRQLSWTAALGPYVTLTLGCTPHGDG